MLMGKVNKSFFCADYYQFVIVEILSIYYKTDTTVLVSNSILGTLGCFSSKVFDFQAEHVKQSFLYYFKYVDAFVAVTTRYFVCIFF